MYKETLWEALEVAMGQFAEAGAVFQEEPFREFNYGGVKYGEVKSVSQEIVTLKGKKTKKFAHITIFREGRGTAAGMYEATAYIL